MKNLGITQGLEILDFVCLRIECLDWMMGWVEVRARIRRTRSVMLSPDDSLKIPNCRQCFRSGLDPDSIRSVDPDPDPDQDPGRQK